ncbi:MAG: NUDIX domain-containing protein [Eubacteriales bacterium]|nr:NUDIX domain-containing protein [Eubacteriales bacterium]
MRRLFEMNARDYDKTGKSQVRHSVRAILLRQGRAATLFSPKTGAYLFPGGELREGEAPAQGLARVLAAEAGLALRPGTLQDFGYVRCLGKNHQGEAEFFVHDHFYYFCQALPVPGPEEGPEGEFVLEWVLPQEAVRANRACAGESAAFDTAREATVLERLMLESYF